jgi:gamma-glutamyltranspeptidase/glutathione hydrolase
MRTLRTLALLLAATLTLAGGCAAPPDGPARYTAVVAADQPLASEAGARILERGGNAVDAAVAAAFTLSVVRPQSCGLGGGGFMVIHLPPAAGHRPAPVDTTINAREWCPGGVDADTFARSTDPHASTVGGLAVAVPGSVAGLLCAQQKYGRLDRETVLQPAIDAADKGFAVDAAYMTAAAETIAKFRADPGLQKRFPFLWQTLLREGGVTEGDRIVNHAQAFALREIARAGVAAFYTGPMSDAIAKACREAGGVLTVEDLAGYSRRGVVEEPPLPGLAFGHTLLTMRPPSSGGLALVQVLSMLDQRHSDALLGVDEPAFAHELAECFKLAFADRATFLADPAFSKFKVWPLLTRADLHARSRLVDSSHTHPPAYYARSQAPLDAARDSGTSHVSAVDRWGGACAATQTINLYFGSYVCVDGYGFLLNNEMDDFTTRRGSANAYGLRQSDDNLPQPGKRPLSSMTPTIVLDSRGNVEAVAGASGGPRIITATTQALINALLRRDDAVTAVTRPRLHHQWLPDTLALEPLVDAAANDRLTESLTAKGHKVQPAKGEAAVQLIVRMRPADAQGPANYTAGCDPRKGGKPAGKTVKP